MINRNKKLIGHSVDKGIVSVHMIWVGSGRPLIHIINRRTPCSTDRGLFMNSIYPNKDGLLQDHNAQGHLAQVAQNCICRKILETFTISQTEILWDEVERGLFYARNVLAFCEYLSKQRENILRIYDHLWTR